MNQPLRCRCGTVQGQVDLEQAVGHAICYCKSCQAYARFLGREQDVLDSRGGTEIIATPPRSVELTAGLDELACMSVTEKGPLRWYARCCRTPIGNTARHRNVAYLGLIRACLPGPDASLDGRLGSPDVALNTESARGEVASTPAATFVALLRIAKMVIGARLSGSYKDNPFFEPGSGKPIQPSHTLGAGERTAAEPTIGG